MISEHLNSIFNVSIKIPVVEKENGRTALILKEIAPEAKLNKVELLDIPRESIIVNLDSCKPWPLLNRRAKGNKRCDYLIFTENNNKKYALFIELKSYDINNTEIIEQFKCSECIFDYLNSILKNLYNSNLEDYTKRFVVFHKAHASKRGTLLQARASNNSPSNPFRYPNPINPSIKSLLQ